MARVSEKEVSELLVPIRIQLELYSIQNNLDYYDKNFFQTLEGIVANMETEIQKHEVFNVTEWDLKFHEAIITFSDSPFLKQIWEGIAQRTRIRVLDYLINYDDSQVKLHSMANTHWNLINTLKSRNFEEISKVFINHIHVND